MSKIDKDAIGASIGVAGVAACVAVAFGSNAWTRSAPVVREYLFANAGPLLIGMAIGAAIAAAGWACAKGGRHE